MSDAELKFANLQFRYTELLENRIAQLEAALAPVAVPKAADTAADTDEKKDTDKKGDDDDDDDESSGDEKDKKDKTGEEKKDDEKKGPKSRYRSVVRKWNKKDGVYVDVDVQLDEKKTEEGETAFTYRTKIVSAEQGDIRDTNSEVDIEAEGLRNLIKESIGVDYPGQNLDGDTVNMAAPYAPLVHNWEKLEEAAQPAEGEINGKKQAREDLVKLLECVKVSPELEKYFKTRDSNIRANITTYDTMWTIFPPKTKVVAKLFLNTYQVFEVAFAPIPRSIRVPRKRYIEVWCWDWNGKEMTKVYYEIPVERFWGTKDIGQLPCYPLEYYQDGNEKEIESLCKTLRVRGQKYSRIVRSKVGASQMYVYGGPALSERRSVVKKKGKDQDNDGGVNAEEEENGVENRRKTVMVKGPVIVDPEAFLQFGADYLILGETEPWLTGDYFGNEADTKEQEPGPDQFLLYPPRILGYSTREKIWGQFSVEHTSDVPNPSISLFKDKLQLDENYKSMIQALVEEHGTRGQSDPDRVKVKDVVEDKGKGLVLLLHGPPGVGKTLTAETIAEATGKPLFIVSVAEIGLDASKAERNLEQMFYLAGKWEAVLLVDEADVFLESRTSDSEPNRNALVSVLLRVLEYYDGIIILTTNRITSLDIAVQSRIHLAIRYDDLDQPQKKNVFRMFLQQLEPKSMKDYPRILEYVDEYASRNKLNGRQIRNVVASALSLARSKAKDKNGNGDPRMTVDHLKEVLYITQDFQEQLESITTDTRRHNEVKGMRR